MLRTHLADEHCEAVRNSGEKLRLHCLIRLGCICVCVCMCVWGGGSGWVFAYMHVCAYLGRNTCVYMHGIIYFKVTLPQEIAGHKIP